MRYEYMRVDVKWSCEAHLSTGNSFIFLTLSFINNLIAATDSTVFLFDDSASLSITLAWVVLDGRIDARNVGLKNLSA